jgi:hypothetical protein
VLASQGLYSAERSYFFIQGFAKHADRKFVLVILLPSLPGYYCLLLKFYVALLMHVDSLSVFPVSIYSAVQC